MRFEDVRVRVPDVRASVRCSDEGLDLPPRGVRDDAQVETDAVVLRLVGE